MIPFIRQSESAQYLQLRATHLAEMPNAHNHQQAFESCIHAIWNIQRIHRLEAAIEQRALRPLPAIEDPALARTIDRLHSAL